ncbi:MAG: hypothetical protein V1647_00015, partial [Pseudomonadota bacterium]
MVFAAPIDKSVGHKTPSPINPSYASETFYKAMDEFIRGNYKASYSDFMKASSAKKTTKGEASVALYNAALSAERNKNYNRAMEIYKSILGSKELSPLHKDSYYRRASCCYETKKWACVLSNLDNW